MVVLAVLVFIVIRAAMQYSRGQAGEAHYRVAVAGLFQKTRADVDGAALHLQDWFPEEAQRLRRLRRSIKEFHYKWEGGQFDEQAMDDALYNLQEFVEKNRLRPQEKKALTEDLDRLLKQKEQQKPPAPKPGQ